LEDEISGELQSGCRKAYQIKNTSVQIVAISPTGQHHRQPGYIDFWAKFAGLTVALAEKSATGCPGSRR
jgi:hypothetical protein